MKSLFRGAGGALAALILGLAAGCATAPEEPVLEAGLADLRFTGVTVFETTAEVSIRLDNLTPEGLEVTGGSHRLRVNGIALGRGVTGETIPLPRLGSAIQPVAFHLKNLSMAKWLQEMGQTRVVEYELESTLYVAKPGGRERTIRVNRSGRLDLQASSGRTADPSRIR